MIADAPNINHLWAALIVEELLRAGVDTFVVSPGSRSTPLATAVAGEPRARGIVHFDERGAGYFAVGSARASGKPAAVVCTSGTAVANLLPSVLEASNARVPLILLTADRPPELLDTGANQTIDHNHIFGSFTRWSALLPCPDRAVPAAYVLTTVDQAVYRASRAPAGPVHLNCPFREPLAPTATGESFDDYLGVVTRWLAGSKPYTEYHVPVLGLRNDAQRNVIETVTNAQQGLLVVGQLNTPLERDAVYKLAHALRWPVIADIASGLRTASGAPVVHYAHLALLSARVCDELRPDAVLWLGGPITSKRTLQFLESAAPSALIRVADHPLRHDPIHRVTCRLEASLDTFCPWLATSINAHKNGPWLDRWRDVGNRAADAVDAFFASTSEVTEPGVVRAVFANAREHTTVFLGNSMPIRDADMVARAREHAPWVIANRGASGIDGNIATVAGVACGSSRPVTAIIGDLAALHDLNSLALLRDAAAPVTLIIINNDGGGIFHFLPVADMGPAFERFFATPHGLRFEHAARMFGLGYTAPQSITEFNSAYASAIESGLSSIIEVTTNRQANKRIHDALYEAVRAALDRP